MKKETKTIEVFTADKNKCLKISDRRGNLITYIKNLYQ